MIKLFVNFSFCRLLIFGISIQLYLKDKSKTDTLTMGTLKARPDSLSFTFGKSFPSALQAPVVAGIMF